MLLVTVSSAGGDPSSECPVRCRCSKLDSYVNSREVKCCSLDLSDIPAMLNLSTVSTLDFSHNKIKILRNATFSKYSSLSTLILSSNEVVKIEINAFAGLRMMRYVDLRYNNLESFNPEIFSSKKVLKNVSLKGNPLAYLSSDSPILISDSVSFLDLSSCSLTTIHPVTFSRLPRLNSLDLSSNLLQTISVSTFEKLPNLRILELHNNRWTCNCDVVEVMQWATARRCPHPAHQPVNCFEGQQSRKLWTTAGGSKRCSESKTTEALLTREREFTTDMTVDLPTVSVGIPVSVKTLQHTTSQPFVVTAGTSEAEIRAAPESETRGWSSLFSWNVNTLMVFVVLPVTLGAGVFVSLIALKYVTRRLHLPQHEIQGKDNHLAALFSDGPLLGPQLTADHRKQHRGYVIRSSDGVRYADYHVYEEIQ